MIHLHSRIIPSFAAFSAAFTGERLWRIPPDRPGHQGIVSRCHLGLVATDHRGCPDRTDRCAKASPSIEASVVRSSCSPRLLPVSTSPSLLTEGKVLLVGKRAIVQCPLGTLTQHGSTVRPFEFFSPCPGHPGKAYRTVLPLDPETNEKLVLLAVERILSSQ